MSNKCIVIIEGPSGVGKDTIINEIIKRYPDKFGKPVNATTREMRDGESQGNPYLFLTEEEFLQRRKSGDIFEQTIRHGTYRGMQKSSFEGILNSNKIAIRDCDRFGLEALKKEFGDIVTSIFITAPKEVIKERLTNRGEKEESMIKRLNDYDTYLQNAIYFDHTIENIDMNETIDKIINIINQKTTTA